MAEERQEQPSSRKVKEVQIQNWPLVPDQPPAEHEVIPSEEVDRLLRQGQGGNPSSSRQPSREGELPAEVTLRKQRGWGG